MEPTSPIPKRRKLADDEEEKCDANECIPEKGSHAQDLKANISAAKGVVTTSSTAKDASATTENVQKDAQNDIPLDKARSGNSSLTEEKSTNDTMNDGITTNAGENSEAVENTKAGGGEAVDINDIGTVYKTPGITYRLLDKSDDVELFLGTLEKCQRFAFDCESIKLGRNNKVSVINICLEDGSIFLIDVQEIGGIPSRLKSVLERNDIKKVMFDCRSDSDSLLHQHQVRLHGIEDMQLMQYIMKHPNKEPAKKLPAFRYTVEEHLGSEKKNFLQAAMPFGHDKWGYRPIQQALLKYASIEISMFLPVRDKLMGVCPEGILSIQHMSEKYANSRREDDEYEEDDEYKCHGFMHLDILMPVYRGNTECVKCGIKLHSSQFSKTQRRNGNQECVVCKAVTWILARNAQWEKEAEEAEEYFYEEPLGFSGDYDYW